MGTSRLQQEAVKQLDRIFGCHAVQENVRPDWLVGSDGHRLELDVFVPSAKIAIEVQGPQHYRYSEHWHGNAEGFERQVKRDKHKRIICTKRGVALYEIASQSDLSDLIVKIKKVQVPPDPRHIASVQRDAQEFCRREVAWLTRAYHGKLIQAREELKKVRERVGPDRSLPFESVRDLLEAESRVEKFEGQLERAETRARNGERPGIKKMYRPKGAHA